MRWPSSPDQCTLSAMSTSTPKATSVVEPVLARIDMMEIQLKERLGTVAAASDRRGRLRDASELLPWACATALCASSLTIAIVLALR